MTSDKSRVRSGKQDQDPPAVIARVAEVVLALSPLGEWVARTGAFFSRRGTGLRPPKGYWRSGRAARYGPQAGEGVDGSMTGLTRR